MISHRMSSRKLRTLLLARMMMMMFTGVCFTNGCVQRERRCVYSMMIKTVCVCVLPKQFDFKKNKNHAALTLLHSAAGR